MPGQKRISSSQIILFATLSLGVGLIVLSAFYPLSSLVIIGIAIISLAAVLLYITPVKHVPLTLLSASAEVAVANIERLISELNLTENGIYLPPKNLKKEPSLVFIPQMVKKPLATNEETNGKLDSGERTGVLVTPPGAALSRLFEKELGLPFADTNIDKIQRRLQKLLVEDMALAESADIQIQGNVIAIEVVGSVLGEVCQQTDSHPRTHLQVGCLLSSAFACILAKVTERPVTILSENRSTENKTIIEYRVFEKKEIQYENMQLEPLISSNPTSNELETVPMRLKNLQSKPPISLDAPLNDTSLITKMTKTQSSAFSTEPITPSLLLSVERKIRTCVNENSECETIDVEVASCALDFFQKNAELFILADIKNPQFSYSKIKGLNFDIDLKINFERFVLISKIDSDCQKVLSNGSAEFNTKTFGLFLGAPVEYSLASYVEKSGFLNVDDWVKASNGSDQIPEDSAGHKIFYLYHIGVANAFTVQEAT